MRSRSPGSPLLLLLALTAYPLPAGATPVSHVEPASALLFGLGLACLAARARRRMGRW